MQVLSAGKDFRRKANRVCHKRLDIGRELWFMGAQVAVSREVLPGRQDLPKTTTAPGRANR
jgi:hypothetical protein